MPGLLSAKVIPLGQHAFQHIAVADRRLFQAHPMLFQV